MNLIFFKKNGPIMLAGMLLLLLFVFASYQYQPKASFKFGHGLDRLYLNNMYPRQTKIDGRSYRRIRAVTHLLLPYVGSGLNFKMTIKARTAGGGETVPFSIYANKKKMIEETIAPSVSPATFYFSGGKIEADYLLLHLINETEKQSVKHPIFLHSLNITPVKKSTMILPPLELVVHLMIVFLFLMLSAIVVFPRALRWVVILFPLLCLFLLLFARWYFLPFVNILTIISVFTFLLAVLLKLSLPYLLKYLNINPRLSEFHLLLVILIFAFVLRAVIWFYPGTITSDIDFHAHKMGAAVTQGNILQTSTTLDRKHQFPYPVFYYLLLAPFKIVSSEISNQTIIKAGLVFLDSFVPLLLFIFAARAMKNTRAGLFAALLYNLLPLSIIKFMWGVATESFACILAWAFMTAIALSYRFFDRFKQILLSAVLLLAVFLSHFGTALETGFFTLVLIVASYLAFSNSKNNHRVTGLILILTLVLIISFLIYYVHYIDLFKEEIQKVIASIFSPEVKSNQFRFRIISLSWKNLLESIGIPTLLLLPFCYSAYLDKRRRTYGFVLLTSVFISSFVLFGISIISPLGLRWILFMLPAVSLVVGWGLTKIPTKKYGKIFTFLYITASFAFALKTWMEVMFNGPYHHLF